MFSRSNHIRSILNNYIKKTPLEQNVFLSDKYKASIFLKREDLQLSRSFKIRGSLYKILKHNTCHNLVTASAGNHAQGVAYSCHLLNKHGTIFLPVTTPIQKINRIKYYGKDNITIKIEGDTFNDSLENAISFCEKNNNLFIHPFDDMDIIEGQSTIALDIFDECNPDYIISSVGGGGLLAGLQLYTQAFNSLTNNKTKVIGVEPNGAASLYESIKQNKRIVLDSIDTFVDGASVSQIGKYNYELLKNIELPILVSNEHISYELINMYQNEGIVLEPAGVMPICALDTIKEDIEGKTVVCVLSGGNNDLTRYNEMMELSLNYLGLKHYFILEFVQKPNQLKVFINSILTPLDDITRFEYIKKTNKNYGRVLIGIEIGHKDNLQKIIDNLDKYHYKYTKLTLDDDLYSFVV
jgi:threonine dehydratase